MTLPTRDAPAAIPDLDRVAVLLGSGLPDTPVEVAFDRLTRLAARILRAPVALVSVVDAERQFLKSSFGLPEPWASQPGAPLSRSFCQHVVAAGKPLVVQDARAVPWLQPNSAAADLPVIAYLGTPVTTADGHTLGALCSIDTAPRVWTPEEVELLRDVAASVVTEIDLRTAHRRLNQKIAKHERTDLQASLQRHAEALVHHVDAALARVWTLDEGANVLELQASAGMYGDAEGRHRRIRLGQSTVDLIAEEGRAHLAGSITGDPRVRDHEWATREGLVGFAGYPLIVGERLVGAVAIFTRHALSEAATQALGTVANAIAQDIRRTRTEEALHTSKEFSTQIVESSTDCINVLDLAGRIVFTSTGGEQLLELADTSSVLSRSWANFWQGSSRKAALDAVTAAKAGRAGKFCGARPTATGVPKWWNVAVTPIRDADGAVHSLLAISRDVTESQRAEEALRQDEQRFRMVAESAGALVYDWDVVTGRLERFGDIAERLGYDPGEFPADAEAWAALIHPEDRHRVRATLKRHLRTGAPFAEEYRVVRKNGAVLHFTDRAMSLRDATGDPVRFIGACTDITKRKQAEEVLRRTNDELRALLQASPLAIVGLDAAGRVLSWNATAERMFGWREDEVVGHRLPNVPDDRQEEFDRLRAMVLGGEAFSDLEAQRCTKQGRLLDVCISTAPLHDAAGRAAGLVAMYSDITARKKEQEEFHASQEQFRHAQKLEAVGRLAGGIAHDFNNLLAAILGTIELLLADMRPGERMWQDLKEIEQATHRASRLTRQLLAFSRTQVLQPKVLNLNAVVTDMERILQRVIGEDVELVTALQPSLGATLADPGQLEQVLMNLAVNARDAMPRGGTLTLATSGLDVSEPRHEAEFVLPPAPYVVLTVCDTGVGMDQATRARVFEPFFTTKERDKGTGLGLSTAYGIIKQSGGYIDVASEPDQGATFTIYLPRVAMAADETPAPERPASSRGSETILLAEDEPLVRSGARRALTRHGYRVLEAADAAEALSIAAGHPGRIDLLLTDVIMPRMSGPELAEQLAHARPEMEVLYTSGYTDDALGQQGTLPVGTNFLLKPFTLTELTHRVREVLDGAAAR